MIARPDWHAQAACADKAAGWHQATTDQQQAICQGCPVLTECCADALANPDVWFPSGEIRAGMTPAEAMAQLRPPPRRGRPPQPILHGTYGGYRQHQRRGVPICGPCDGARAAYMQLRRALRTAET